MVIRVEALMVDLRFVYCEKIVCRKVSSSVRVTNLVSTTSETSRPVSPMQKVII